MIAFLPAPAFREVTLPEPADLLVTECMGNFFVTDELAPVLRAARRLVKPDGIVIPERIRMRIAPVFMPMNDDLAFWQPDVHGLDLSAGRSFALQSTYVRHVDPRLLVCPPETLSEFHLFDSPDTVSGELRFRLTAPSTVHGFVGWFDAALTPSITLDTGPGVRTHWAQVLFPIEGLRLPEGAELRLSIALAMSETYSNRWRWSGDATAPDGTPLGEFAHDTDLRLG